MTPDIQELKDLTTIIAELEEAERAVRPGAFSVHETELVYGSRCTIRRPDGSVICDTVIDRKDARLTAYAERLETETQAIRTLTDAMAMVCERLLSEPTHPKEQDHE